MARYIDADKAIELLKSLGSRDYRREKGTICDAIKMLQYSEYTPTADVVPKSEVEKLREINSLLTEAGQEWQKRYNNAKAEVAREIFAEIEKTAKDAIRFCEIYGCIPMIREAKISCYKDLLGYIAELKKKYVEGEG